MTELAESIAISIEQPWECPFSHRQVTHNKKNVVPEPSTVNDSTKLGNNLADASSRREPIDVEFDPGTGSRSHSAQFSPHHLIPGNEAWPKSDLYKWIDKRKGHILGDIGYDVNVASNGIDLPSHTTIDSWSSKLPKFQRAFAFATMDAVNRQFHDRHPAYSSFVIKVLNKVAAKLEVNESPGCGKKNCSAGVEKPFAPPYEMLVRLEGISMRLANYLQGDYKNWRKPLITSRFSLMYHKKNTNPKMTQDQARAELSVDNFR